MSRWRQAVLVVSIAALVRLAFAAVLPLFPDETYYWEWSRHLAAGYFDHPSGVAISIRFGTALLAPFGLANTALAVRLGALLCGWIAALATIGMARLLGGGDSALRAAIVLTVLPLAAAGLVLTTPDPPLLATAAVALYCLTRALYEPPASRRSTAWWALAGIVLGLAFSSKYTSIFLPVGVVVAIVARPSLRVRLREPGPYLACVLATIVFLPVLFWNAQHGWLSFVFQLQHGLSKPQGSVWRAAWRHEGDFFGGQIGLASPILFFLLAIATWRAVRSSAERPPAGREPWVRDARFVLAIVTILSFAFFIYSAIRQRVEPNWPAMAYIPAVVLLATTNWGPVARRWLKAGIAFAAVMTFVIYAQGLAPILPLAPRKDPIARAFGWSEMARAADSTARAAQAATGAHTWLAADRYQEASELAFYAPSHPTTFATNLSGRTNQYALWPGFSENAKQGDNLVMVVDDSNDDTPHPAIAELMPYFTTTQRGALVSLRRGNGEIGTRRIWLLSGWRGSWPVAQ